MTKVAKVYWSLAFIVSTAATILVNAAHAGGALASPGTWTARLVAGTPPLILAIVTEGYFLVRRSIPKRVQRVVKISAGGLAAAAFAVSYETSRLFVIAQTGPLPEWVGWVIPGMVDTLVAVSGYVLYVLAEHGAAADVDVRRPSRWMRIADNIGARMEAATEPKPAAVNMPVSEFVNRHEQVREPVPEPTQVVHEEVPEPVTNPETDVPERAAKRPAKKPAKVREQVREDLEPFIPAAKWMLETRAVTRKTDVEVAEIIKLIDAGNSSYEIRKQLGGSTSTYDKLIEAWEQWRDQTTTDADHHPDQQPTTDRQLTAVG